MVKIVCFVLCLSIHLMLSACATQQFAKSETGYESKDNWLPVYGIGASVTTTEEGLMVATVDSGAPASKAGILAGDVIVTVNGSKITNKDFFSLLQKSSDKDIVISAIRGGQVVNHTLRPIRLFKWPPSAEAINTILLEEQPVKLAVYVAEVRSAVRGTSRSGEEAQRQQWHGFINNHVLKEFGKYKHFAIVNTELIYNTLDRNRYEMSGPIPEDARALIRRLTGATHLLVATLSRLHDDKHSLVDISDARLVELSSGKDLAFDQRVDCK